MICNLENLFSKEILDEMACLKQSMYGEILTKMAVRELTIKHLNAIGMDLLRYHNGPMPSIVLSEYALNYINTLALKKNLPIF